MKTYTISKKEANFSWAQVPALDLDTPLWLPRADISAQAKLCYDDQALYIHLQAVEQHIRAEETGPLGAPCEDSCLEFFFSPIPGDSRYFNIEFNPNGCMFLGFGSNRYNLVRLLPIQEVLSPQIHRTEDGWEVEYRIPASFIQMFFPEFTMESGKAIRANCYKCGNQTVQKHYFCWNPIELEKPDYHCPQFFGTMEFA